MAAYIEKVEYIEREALQNQLSRKKPGPATQRYTEGWNDAILRVKSMVHSAKAADVAPVRHGKWIENYGAPNVKRCSVCKAERHAKESWWRYCPKCGAKMRGENNE